MITRLMLQRLKEFDTVPKMGENENTAGTEGDVSVALNVSVKTLKPLQHNGAQALPNGVVFHDVVSRRMLIDAQTDPQAIDAWISKYKSGATRANYQKELDRFLLWCHSRSRTFSTLTAEDLFAYSAFIGSLDILIESDPVLADQWISPKRHPRADIRWRPFQGPLSKASQRQAMIAIGACLRWLEKARYLDGSPAALMEITKVRRSKVDRYLPWEAIGYLLDAADALPEKTRDQALVKTRIRFLVALFSLTGARLSDIPQASMSSFRRQPDGLWWWHVIGKGDKEELIPVPSDLLAELKRYRSALQLSELPASDETLPLIASLRGGGPASEATLYVALTGLLERAALQADDRDPDMAGRLRNASPHWLRHTALTKQADNGVDLRWIQANARHDDINTTMQYLHIDDRARHEATDKVMRLRDDK